MLTTAIYLMGIATVALSIAIAWLFHKNNSTRLGAALKWQLIGEAVIGLGTLIFAVGAHTGWLADWSVNSQSFIRFIMFLATSLTTLHLWQTARNI